MNSKQPDLKTARKESYKVKNIIFLLLAGFLIQAVLIAFNM